MVVYTKSGVTVNCCGNLLIASDSKTYNLCGRMLTCSGKIISYNCQSKDEALGTVWGCTAVEGFREVQQCKRS